MEKCQNKVFQNSLIIRIFLINFIKAFTNNRSIISFTRINNEPYFCIKLIIKCYENFCQKRASNVCNNFMWKTVTI